MPSKTDWEQFLAREYDTDDFWFNDDGSSKYFKDEAEFLEKRGEIGYLSEVLANADEETLARICKVVVVD